MALPIMDETEWPLLKVTFPETMTVDEIRTHFVQLTRVFDRKIPFASLVDGTRVQPSDFSAAHRRVAGEALKVLEPSFRRYSVGQAFVSASAVARGIVTAVFWLAPPACPTEIFGSVTEARTWALRRLHDARKLRA